MPSPPPLIGTYDPPPVRIGERVTCLFRDTECVVTAFSAAPIQWPRVRAVEHRGGSGLWVNETLVKAIRTESAAALQHHFGVTGGVVWRWRKAFGVGGHATTKGSRRAIRTAAQAGAASVKAKVWTLAELRAKSVTSNKLGLRPTGRWKGREWTPEEVALLGTDHDEAIARRIGRSRSAVTTQRVRRGITESVEASYPPDRCFIAHDDELSRRMDVKQYQEAWDRGEYAEFAAMRTLNVLAGAAALDYVGPGKVSYTADPEYQTGLLREHTAQSQLVREIVGNPFRPVTFSSEWRTDTVLSLARTMYDGRDFSAMPILADALQDAGCEVPDILNHCRSGGVHVRGCWVVDLVLGKE
jgi:hypothetical protein